MNGPSRLLRQPATTPTITTKIVRACLPVHTRSLSSVLSRPFRQQPKMSTSSHRGRRRMATPVQRQTVPSAETVVLSNPTPPLSAKAIPQPRHRTAMQRGVGGVAAQRQQAARVRCWLLRYSTRRAPLRWYANDSCGYACHGWQIRQSAAPMSAQKQQRDTPRSVTRTARRHILRRAPGTTRYEFCYCCRVAAARHAEPSSRRQRGERQSEIELRGDILPQVLPAAMPRHAG